MLSLWNSGLWRQAQPQGEDENLVRSVVACNEGYINDLKSIVAYYGIYEDEIDEILADGVTPEEIEELLNGA